MRNVNNLAWYMEAVIVRQPMVTPIIFHDGVSWCAEPALIRTTAIVELPFPRHSGPAAGPELNNPVRENERTSDDEGNS